jgi:membrane-associated phospholipid phosphatase
LRLVAYGAAIAFGAGIGALRIGAGAHFLSDVVFAGVFIYLVIWTAYGLIYRWPRTRLSEPAIDRLLTQAGEALRASLAALARRLMAWTKKSP